MQKNFIDTNPDEERIQFLQRVLLDFLAVKAQNDEAYKFARHFYIAQWYKEAVNEKSQLASGEGKNKRLNAKENHKSRRMDKGNQSKFN